MFVSDLRQVGGFLRVLRFPPLIKLTSTIRIGTDTLDVLVGLELLILMHFSTIFQLYRGGEFYWWRKPECREKTRPVTSHEQTLSHNVFTFGSIFIALFCLTIKGGPSWL
jgi:hypothetical protein